MFRTIVRWLGWNGEAEPMRSPSVRFSPRLESLDGRAMPSVTVVGGLDGYGGRPGGVLANEVGGGASVIDGGSPGGVLGDAVGHPGGEVVPLGGARGGVSLIYGGARGGVSVIDGGMPGGVLGDAVGNPGGEVVLGDAHTDGVTLDQGDGNELLKKRKPRGGSGEEIPQVIVQPIGEKLPQGW